MYLWNVPADLDQQLQADLERLRQKQAAAAPAAPSRPAAPASRSGIDGGEAEGGALAGVKDAVDKVRGARLAPPCPLTRP